MLGGLALKCRWQQRARGRRQADRPPEPRHGHQRPGLLGEVRQLLGRRDAARADGGRPLHLAAEEAVALCDENTIGVVAILGSTFDGSYEPVKEICDALDDLAGADRARCAGPRRRRIRRASSRRSSTPTSSGTSGCRAWRRSTPRATSTGSSTPASAGSLWRDAEALPEDLVFWVNYLGGNMPTFALNFSRPGGQVVAQYYNFLRLGFDGYRAVHRRTRARSLRDLSGADRGARAVPADHAGRRAPGLRVHAERRRRQLHRLRRLERAPGTRLARARLHLPRESDRPGRTPRGGQARFQSRRRRPAGGRCQAAAPRLQKQPAPMHEGTATSFSH